MRGLRLGRPWLLHFGSRLGLRPGMKLTVLDKGGVIYLVPDRPLREYRGVARGSKGRGLRDKKDRL